MLAHSTGLTRAELSRHLMLSKATVSALVGDLLDRGVVTEQARTGGAVGRPGTLVRLAGPDRTFATLMWSDARMRIVVSDFGGTIVADRSVTVTTQLSPADLAAVVTAELAERAEIIGVVLSLPAPFQPGVGIPIPGGVALGSELPDSPMWLHGRWLANDPVPVLAEALGLPGPTVLAENDANLAALGEVAHGAGRGHDSVAYVKVTANTMGMGLVLGGRIHRGASGFAGELAHIQVDPNGPLCHCGGRGCLRGLLGTALLDAVRPAYDRPLEFTDVLALAAAGDPGPRRMLDDVGRALGRGAGRLLHPAQPVGDRHRRQPRPGRRTGRRRGPHRHHPPQRPARGGRRSDTARQPRPGERSARRTRTAHQRGIHQVTGNRRSARADGEPGSAVMNTTC